MVDEYSDCVADLLLNGQSWVVALVFFGVSIVVWSFGWRRIAVLLTLAGLLFGIADAYAYYEFNCVEFIA